LGANFGWVEPSTSIVEQIAATGEHALQNMAVELSKIGDGAYVYIFQPFSRPGPNAQKVGYRQRVEKLAFAAWWNPDNSAGLGGV
jgi:hypothetical protein